MSTNTPPQGKFLELGILTMHAFLKIQFSLLTEFNIEDLTWKLIQHYLLRLWPERGESTLV